MAGVPTTGRRAKAARGTVVNSVYLIGLNGLALIRGFAVAGFVTVAEYGVWGLLVVAFTSLYGLVQIGVNDKYIQQDSEDQEAAFQIAFTLQLALSLFFVVLMIAIMPVYALAYGNWDILRPGWALALAMPASAFQAPLWTFYRRLDYMRQRQLQAIDPILNFVVTLSLAAAGFGYWSFVIGMVCGGWAGAIVAVRASPYKLKLRYEPGTAREYASFSGPLMFQGLCVAVIQLAPVMVAQRTFGTATVGAMAIASNISRYTLRVDQIVTNTLYPVVCAVKDRRDLLQEAFLKSNRLGLLWAGPAGVGIFLFAPDLVNFVIGSRWDDAIPIIQSLGLVAMINQIGFNWSAFYRAIGNTKPIAVGGVVMAISVAAIATPLLYYEGIQGYAIGVGISALILVGVRLFYLNKLFSLRPIFRNIAQGLVPVVVAVTGTVALRMALWGGDRAGSQAILELAVFLGLAGTATVISARALLAEFRDYLKRPSPASA